MRNPWKIIQNRAWRCVGPSSGLFEVPYWRPWASWERLGSVLGAFWSVLGGSRWRPGPKRILTWTPFGVQNPSKIDSKSHWFFDRFLDASLDPKWGQNGSRKLTKSITNMSKTASGLRNVIFWKIAPRFRETLIFENPGVPKQSQHLPKTAQEPTKNPT